MASPPQGFNPAASMLPDNPSAHIQVMRGGGRGGRRQYGGAWTPEQEAVLEEYGMGEGGPIVDKIDELTKKSFLIQIADGRCRSGTGDKVVLHKDCRAVVEVIRALIKHDFEKKVKKTYPSSIRTNNQENDESSVNSSRRASVNLEEDAMAAASLPGAAADADVDIGFETDASANSTGRSAPCVRGTPDEDVTVVTNAEEDSNFTNAEINAELAKLGSETASLVGASNATLEAARAAAAAAPDNAALATAVTNLEEAAVNMSNVVLEDVEGASTRTGAVKGVASPLNAYRNPRLRNLLTRRRGRGLPSRYNNKRLAPNNISPTPGVSLSNQFTGVNPTLPVAQASKLSTSAVEMAVANANANANANLNPFAIQGVTTVAPTPKRGFLDRFRGKTVLSTSPVATALPISPAATSSLSGYTEIPNAVSEENLLAESEAEAVAAEIAGVTEVMNNPKNFRGNTSGKKATFEANLTRRNKRLSSNFAINGKKIRVYGDSPNIILRRYNQEKTSATRRKAMANAASAKAAANAITAKAAATAANAAATKAKANAEEIVRREKQNVLNAAARKKASLKMERNQLLERQKVAAAEASKLAKEEQLALEQKISEARVAKATAAVPLKKPLFSGLKNPFKRGASRRANANASRKARKTRRVNRH